VSSRTAITILLALSAIVAIVACSDEADADAASVQVVAAAEAVEMLPDRTIIDVRTPGEFAAGHLDGAVNIDVQAADFGDRIAELDPDGAYLVYCRSGRRSAIAAEQMAEAGFTDIADAGGLAELAEAGAPLAS
jgi:rhodanese-related sulfurtransferase